MQPTAMASKNLCLIPNNNKASKNKAKGAVNVPHQGKP